MEGNLQALCLKLFALRRCQHPQFAHFPSDRCFNQQICDNDYSAFVPAERSQPCPIMRQEKTLYMNAD